MKSLFTTLTIGRFPSGKNRPFVTTSHEQYTTDINNTIGPVQQAPSASTLVPSEDG